MNVLCRENGKARVEFISPRRTWRLEGKDSSSWSSCPRWLKTGFIRWQGGFVRDDPPVAWEGCAAAQPCRTEYRSVTLGNGDVLRRTAIFPGIVLGARPSRSLGAASRSARSDNDVPGGPPTTARETHALPGIPNQFDPIRPVSTYFDQRNKKPEWVGFAVSRFAAKAETGADDSGIRHYSALFRIIRGWGCQGFLAGSKGICDGQSYGL